MKANLKAAQRMYLLGILPNEGDFTTLRILRDMKAKLSFTEDEHAKLKFVKNGEMVNWDITEDKEVSFDFEPKALSIIVVALEEREKAKRLTLETLELYEIFINSKDKE